VLQFLIEDLPQLGLQLLFFITVGVGPSEYVAMFSIMITLLSIGYTVWYFVMVAKEDQADDEKRREARRAQYNRSFGV
jgi:hypothetical protein